MNKNKTFGLICVTALGFFLFGCSMLENSVMRGIRGGIREGVSSGVENQVDTGSAPEKAPETAPASAPAASKRPAAGPRWNQYMITQAQMAFNYAFSAGGMWAGQNDYKPGEYTKFRWTMRNEDPIVLERARLRDMEDGRQWWRVAWEDREGLWIWEALLDPGSSQIIRMRARDPDGNEGEVPVTGQSVYMAPASLTEESVRGATEGKEKVKVPAGTFQADRAVFMSGDGQVEFWLAPQVPGGVVKYLVSQKREGVLWTSELLEFGKKASTILKSY